MGIYVSKTTLKLLEYAAYEAPIRLLLGLQQKSEAEILSPFGRVNAQKRYSLKKKLQKLVTQDLIILGGENILLTEKGKRLLVSYQHSAIQLTHNRWDGLWHIVSYDIPNTKNRARDAFRNQLRNWNFYQIQKSMWATPYECKEEVAIIGQDYRIAPYILYLNATDLPMAKKLIKYFDLEKPLSAKKST